MWILVFSAEFYFTEEILPASIPLFELVILFRKHIFSVSGPTTIIAEEERSHESTLAEFLPVAHLPTVCETLMSTMAFTHTEADADLFSSMYMGPSIMHYAKCKAKQAANMVNLTKLKVEAVIVDDATPDTEGMDFITPPTLDPQLYMVYQPTSSSSLYHSSLIMIDWTEGDDSCPVCLDEFGSGEKVGRLSCHHYFHRHCIIEWLFQSGNCPICRHCHSIDSDATYDSDDES